MLIKRNSYNGDFKAKVAIEAIKNEKSMSELSSFYSVHPNQIGKWKKQLLEGAKDFFSNSPNREKKDEALISKLYQEIGQLTVELEWLKKKLHNF